MICYKCGKTVKNTDSLKHGLHLDCFTEWFAVSAKEDFKDIVLKQAASQSLEVKSNINSSFFHGKFKKYAANLANSEYIIKVEDKDFKQLPATEYLSNQIAQSLDLLVPSFFLIKFENKLNAFIFY